MQNILSTTCFNSCWLFQCETHYWQFLFSKCIKNWHARNVNSSTDSVSSVFQRNILSHHYVHSHFNLTIQNLPLLCYKELKHFRAFSIYWQYKCSESEGKHCLGYNPCLLKHFCKWLLVGIVKAVYKKQRKDLILFYLEYAMK